MNKKQIRQALESKQNKKLNEIRKEYEILKKAEVEKYVKSLYGSEIIEFDELLYKLRNNKDLKRLSQLIIKMNVQDKTIRISNSHNIEVISNFLSNVEDLEIKYYMNSYRNNTGYYYVNQNENRVTNLVNEEYQKLFSILKTMTADKFYEFLKTKGVDIELKEEVKYQISTDINTKLL